MVGNLYYTVDGEEAAVTGVNSRNVRTLTIPATIKIGSRQYKVTGIAPAALTDMKKLTSLTIGKNVFDIGKQAVANCSKLKTIIIKTKHLTASSVKAGAFKNDKAVQSVKCPAGKKANYKKILSKKGLGKKVKWK